LEAVVAVRRVAAARRLTFWSARSGLLIAALGAIVLLVLGSPVLMAGLSSTALPWGRLADVGDAFGGASALLSAVALCGIGASLIFQRRQVRQELSDIVQQQHLEIIRLAIDNPEFISCDDELVHDLGTAGDR
jgi:hypothetical protein